MGSRSSSTKDTNLAYIAGFLDGDGTLMLQVKKRSDSGKGVRFMATICLYQDTRHEEPLLWIQKQVKCGYISRRNDGMTEVRINGFSQVRGILEMLLPYIRFKRVQARALLKACLMLEKQTLRTLSQRDIRTIVDLILLIQQENYMSKGRRTKEDLYQLLGLTP